MKLEISVEQIEAAFQGAIIKQGGVHVATFIWCLN
jgi:hypothetical protein